MDLVFASFAGAVTAASAMAVWIERQRNVGLSAQLHTDELTGLPNRRALRQQARHYQVGGMPWSLLLLDVDNFKGVNDRLGHAAGDALLVHLGRRLAAASAHAGGQTFRLHGDELVLLLPCSAWDAFVFAHALADSISWPVQLRQAGVELGLSIGVVSGSPHARLERLLRDADAAMYAAKRERIAAVLYRPCDHDRQEPAPAAGRRRRRDGRATRPGVRRRRFVLHRIRR